MHLLPSTGASFTLAALCCVVAFALRLVKQVLKANDAEMMLL